MIQKSTESDLTDISHINKVAFGKREGPVVAKLATDLLHDPSAMPHLSLIATNDTQATGYILFTKAALNSAENPASAVLLAPFAVVANAQSQGVGGQLIEEGLKRLAEAGVDLVFVLGHPEYYPRYGFRPAGALGFDAPYPILEKNAGAWMVQELRPGIIRRVHGKVLCADVLNQPEHWRE